MIFGYARVSTKDQNLDMQLDALKKAGCEKIFMEKESGAKNDRKERERLFEQLREGDVVIVYNLFRFGRSVIDIIQKIEMLITKGVVFKTLDGIDTSVYNAMGKFNITVFSAFGELVRNLIVENTNDGLKAARARGRVGGAKPKLTPKQQKDVTDAYQKGGISVNQLAASFGVSRNTIYNVVNQTKQPK